MIYQQDWIMRQIQAMVQMIAKILFGKESVTYEINDETNMDRSDLLHKELLELIHALKLNEAEDLLFNGIDTKDQKHLIIAMDFYNRLNELNDEQLEEADFTREEIKTGIDDILKRFHINIFDIDGTQL